MATAIYNLTTTPYTGLTICIYTGSNFTAVESLVGTSTAPTQCNIIDGKVYVFGELIEIGDAVAVTTDGSPAPHAKISAAQLITDMYSLEVLVYTGSNQQAVIDFMGRERVTYIATVLRVDGAVVAQDEAVAKHRIPTVYGGKLGKTALTNYTVET